MFTDYDFVQFYIKQLEDYDNSWMIKQLQEAIKKGNTILELGSGIGLDYDSLKHDYDVIASEYSDVFIDEFKSRHADAILKVDARDFNLDYKVDAVYGNKVLPFIRYTDLNNTVTSLKNNLNDNGILFLTFWNGDEEQHIEYTDDNGKEIDFWLSMYNKDMLKYAFGSDFELQFIDYKVMEEDDSFIMIATKR